MILTEVASNLVESLIAHDAQITNCKLIANNVTIRKRFLASVVDLVNRQETRKHLHVGLSISQSPDKRLKSPFLLQSVAFIEIKEPQIGVNSAI